MRLTKKTARTIALKLWRYCEETGKDKESWPEWEKYGEMVNDCPLCEYNGKHGGNYCEDTCLVSWPGEYCFSDDSPFDLWDETFDGIETEGAIQERKRLAGLVADLIERSLEG